MDSYKCQVEGGNHSPGSPVSATFTAAYSASVLFAAKIQGGLMRASHQPAGLQQQLFCNQDTSVEN